MRCGINHCKKDAVNKYTGMGGIGIYVCKEHSHGMQADPEPLYGEMWLHGDGTGRRYTVGGEEGTLDT